MEKMASDGYSYLCMPLIPGHVYTSTFRAFSRRFFQCLTSGHTHIHTGVNHARGQWEQLRADYGPTFTQCKDFLVSGPITALAAVSPQRKVTIFGRRTSGGHMEGPQGRNPLAFRECGTIINPLELSGLGTP